jgi:hypothetical protein
MRNLIAMAFVSVALMTGLAATPAAASTAAARQDTPVRHSVETSGVISPADLLASARRAGHPYSLAQTKVIEDDSYCRWARYYSGWTNRWTGNWDAYVESRLNWCYDGTYVNSATSHYWVYSYNTDVFSWGGWVRHYLHDTGNYSEVTSDVEGLFYYDGYTYYPWVVITGYNSGSYHWSRGGV